MSITYHLSKPLRLLPPRVQALLMVWLWRTLPLISKRHRSRFRIAKQLCSNGVRIGGGPFEGMRYYMFACGSPLLPKLAGTYEIELVPVIKNIVELSPDLIIDIG